MTGPLRRALRLLGGGDVEPELVVQLPEPLAAQVRTLLADGRRTEAVRVTRRRTLLPLLLAVRAVDALGDGPPAQPAG